MGHLGSIVYVIHGSRLVRCASCRVIKAAVSNENLNKVKESQPEVDENPSEKQNETVNEQQTKNHEKNPTQNDKITRPKRQIKVPSRFIPEDGSWQQDEKEANVVFIPKERHDEPEVVETKQDEIDNWRRLEAVDVADDKKSKSHQYQMGNN